MTAGPLWTRRKRGWQDETHEAGGPLYKCTYPQLRRTIRASLFSRVMARPNPRQMLQPAANSASLHGSAAVLSTLSACGGEMEMEGECKAPR